MNDWNHDGKYDHYDYNLDNEFSGKGGSGRKEGSAGSFWIVFIIALIVGAFNELVGAAILLGWIIYQIVFC